MKYLIFLILTTTILNATVGTIIKVVDGDTIKIRVANKVSSYRLADIDTPESYLSKKALKDIKKCKVLSYIMMHVGLLSKEYVESIYKPGDSVEFTIYNKGYYGRYIIVIDDLNKKLVKYGYAKVYPKVTNKKLHDELIILEKEAVSKRIGIWRYLKKSLLLKIRI